MLPGLLEVNQACWSVRARWKEKNIYSVVKGSSWKSSHGLSESLFLISYELTPKSVFVCLFVCFKTSIHPPALEIILLVKIKLCLEWNPNLPLTKWTVCRKRMRWRVFLCWIPEAITLQVWKWSVSRMWKAKLTKFLKSFQAQNRREI